MRELMPKEQGELDFWIDHIIGLGCLRESGKSYLEQWSEGARNRLQYYSSVIREPMHTEDVLWVDVGCGPYSVLLQAPDGVTKVMIDPLMKHYFHHKLVPKEAYGARHVFLEGFAEDLALANEKGILGLITQIVKSIDEKDAYGNERSPRAYTYANSIAQALRLSKEHAELVSLSAAFSNIGKLSVPEDLLRKNGPLNDEEMALIRKAPSLGAKFLEPAKMLYKLSSVIEALHEHWDGSGYPKGLKNEEIPLESRIISLVDAYVAMTSDRPYRKSLSKQEAIKQIQDDSGKKFDPRLVRFMLTVLQKEG